MSKPIDIIAEVGSVHDGSFSNARHLIDLAAECGATAVKFQTHIAEAETLRDAPMPPYFTAEPRFEYFERTAFRSQQWLQLKKYADDIGIEFLSSSFSIEAVELLEKVGVKSHKIPSGEVTNLPLVEAIAQTNKPVLLSSGMSSWAELDEAVNAIRSHHNHLTVLQCTSQYPCPYEQVGFNAMLEMRERYKLPVGFSDHTLSIYASLAAVALGACVIEKHLTFSRLMYGSDAKNSLEPSEFKDLVQGIRAIETMVSSKVDKDDQEAVAMAKITFEKSVVSVVDIPEGNVITQDMIGIKKPGSGIPSKRLKQVLGKRTRRRIPKDSLISEKDLVGTSVKTVKRIRTKKPTHRSR